ncbi:hypothetical protein GGX14DRAFT_611156 [Mycena pura]|uniref:Uncharacterized protein n=1 Tax=Mycena pura TaxID=153505 RepID=A0AAD6VRY0_9AGAR|nr:hypothetical protein GGX14DRAFT_611156 [Mycena pura]
MESIKITRTRALIEVTEVVVGGAIITTHGRKSLADFGPTPFKVVCLRSHLRLSSELHLPSAHVATLPRPTSRSSPAPPQVDPGPTEHGLGALLETELNSAIDHDPTTLKDFAGDPQSQAEGAAVLSEALHVWGNWKSTIRSRVIKDPFHIFNMFYISVAHGLRVEFTRALRDAIFIPDPVDKARIIAWGAAQSPSKDWNTITGKRYRGHFSIWVINEIEELLSYTEDILAAHHGVKEAWVNGNLYQPTNEVSGVLPIPEGIRTEAGMAKFEPLLDSVRPHHRLASLQGTRKAVLPVHNRTEKELFRELMAGSNSFGNFSSAKQVESAVKIWNARADAQDDIYYKLPEQLKVYYSGEWQTNSNIKQTKAMTADSRASLMSRIHDPTRFQFTPAVPETTLKPHHVPGGMLSLEPLLTMPDEVISLPSIISDSGLSSGTSAPSTIAATQFVAGSSRNQDNVGPVLPRNNPHPQRRKRGTRALAESVTCPRAKVKAASTSAKIRVGTAARLSVREGTLSSRLRQCHGFGVCIQRQVRLRVDIVQIMFISKTEDLAAADVGQAPREYARMGWEVRATCSKWTDEWYSQAHAPRRSGNVIRACRGKDVMGRIGALAVLRTGSVDGECTDGARGCGCASCVTQAIPFTEEGREKGSGTHLTDAPTSCDVAARNVDAVRVPVPVPVPSADACKPARTACVCNSMLVVASAGIRARAKFASAATKSGGKKEPPPTPHSEPAVPWETQRRIRTRCGSKGRTRRAWARTWSQCRKDRDPIYGDGGGRRSSKSARD